MSEAVTRVRQGVRALLAFAQPVDYALAERYLSPEQMTVFRRLNRDEQLHSLNVLRDVLAQGSTPDDLAMAALLHDVGKSCYPIAVWQKTLAVLVKAGMPDTAKRLRQASPDNLIARPFVVREKHPLWSAELVRETGLSQRALWLIEHHGDDKGRWNDHPYADLLRRLQTADDAN